VLSIATFTDTPASVRQSKIDEHSKLRFETVKLGIQMHVAGLSLSNTTSVLESLGVERSRKAVHDWVHKADLQPDEGKSPDHVAIDETVIQINNKKFWLYAAVDTQNNQMLHVGFFHSTTTIATEMFLRELAENHDVDNSLFLVDGAQHLQTALRRAGLRFQVTKHGNRNSVERIEVEDFLLANLRFANASLEK
jgi:transposase-like protein